MLPRRRTRRRGMTVVETALVLGVFLMLLFGIFEYCRFLMVLHVTNNAARDGARYAVVNLNRPSTFDTTDYVDASGNTYMSVVNYTTYRMSGVQNQLTGVQIAVYPVDPTGLTQTPPVVRPKTTSTGSPATYPDPFNPSDPNKTAWNDAIFTERVAVTIKGTYTPATPVLLLMPSTIPLTITAISGSEG